MSEDSESRLIMNRPRRDDIDPMVPELESAPYAADGGVHVTTAADSPIDTETEAPLVPDLS